MPRPESSPADDWQMETEQGYALYRASGRQDLTPPPLDESVRYFASQAPDELVFSEGLYDCPVSATHKASSLKRKRVRPAGITHLSWIDLGLDSVKGPALVACDIGTGTVNAYWPSRPEVGVKRLSTLFQPVHAERCDLDQDGRVDLLVSDIGEFNADDSDLGRVVWLQRSDREEKFVPHTLIEGLSRVADARPGDFDGDGDIDVLVAAFGWRNSGSTMMLVNEGADGDGKPRFVRQDIDERHGPVHLPPLDFDGDGDLDFIALLSQEHERVELFRNDGAGRFKPELLWAAPDPAYGGCGIELADLDGDGDQDVVFANGDSFDRGPKPCHSIQWLENVGSTPFVHHHICHMPGVMHALPGDFDNDGDQDLVAAALLPRAITSKWDALSTTSILMLVNDGTGGFTKTKIGGRSHTHISVAKGDFDSDGRLDFAVGNFFRTGDGDLKELVEEPELLLWISK